MSPNRNATRTSLTSLPVCLYSIAYSLFAFEIVTGVEVQNPSLEPETSANRTLRVPIPPTDLAKKDIL